MPVTLCVRSRTITLCLLACPTTQPLHSWTLFQATSPRRSAQQGRKYSSLHGYLALNLHKRQRGPRLYYRPYAAAWQKSSCIVSWCQIADNWERIPDSPRSQDCSLFTWVWMHRCELHMVPTATNWARNRNQLLENRQTAEAGSPRRKAALSKAIQILQTGSTSFIITRQNC